MAITHSLAPIPKWVIINNQGTVAGGAYMYTYRSLNKTEQKPVYQDPAGTIPWTNPIIFDLNGTEGPFYWTVDSTALNDTYYIEVWSGNKNDPNSGATLLFTIDDYFPPGDGGGGGSSTTYAPLVNYITNNQFIDHIDDMGSAANLTNTVIAPSNHKGFTPANSNPINSDYGVLGPDIRFVKNNTGLASDQITFPVFPLASYPLTGDVTPVDYVRYQCSTSPAGETYKCFQFPITQKVKNLSAQSLTFGVWAAVTALPVQLNFYYLQYFGSGTSASATVRTLIGTANLTTSWDWFSFNFAAPSVAGKSLGTPGQQTNDDAVYIQIEMPLSVPADVLFTKPALFLGNIDPELEFDSYDQIDSINQTPRTGAIRSGYYPVTPRGWVAMNDGSIGNAGSGATNRANQDTFQLYKTLWDGVSDTYAPVSTGRGASAVADFIAGKTLTLPLALGRALAQLGTATGVSGATNWVLGQNTGEQTHAITVPEMPAHTHPTPNPGTQFYAYITSGAGALAGGINFILNQANETGSTGGSTAMSLMQPTTFTNFIIKL